MRGLSLVLSRISCINILKKKKAGDSLQGEGAAELKTWLPNVGGLLADRSKCGRTSV